MARTGRPKAPLTVTGEQRAVLERGARAATSTQAYALRCRIVLACAEPGSFNTRVAAGLGVSVPTVVKWRGRFIDRGLPGLADEDRPGRPPSILLDKAGEVIAATLEETPAGATHWSRASMARRSGLSESTIGRIWRKSGLKPHLTDGFKLSTDPLLSRRSSTLSACITTRPNAPWSSAWTRKHRWPWTGPSRCSR